MTDRELLELAAEAAGIRIDKSPYNGGGHGNTGFDCMGNAVLDWHNGKTWNPLTDDGDALRLAVQLQMTVSVAFLPIREDWVAVIDPRPCPDARGRTSLATEYSRDDPAAATRRAIVRAAASLARQG